ncbi:MAG: response regulator [Candidatus Pseudomonas phytovorans]|uniref:Response regulator n=1 Tax=Candidatus Pseudomonas phytovorans TaxID=3121377 RepID=A0AAJ6BDV6_9PSED|nr:response regulator [Pseudomonas sp.]WEK31176.1 MAG: response regulator [Pseudomonas sp.]
MNRWVCIVDDDASVRKSLANLLRSAGFETLSFATAAAFLGSDLAWQAGCVLLDLKMQGMGGLDVQRALAGQGRCLPVICMSAHWDDGAVHSAMSLGALACLGKPFSEEVLLKAVEEALAGKA